MEMQNSQNVASTRHFGVQYRSIALPDVCLTAHGSRFSVAHAMNEHDRVQFRPCTIVRKRADGEAMSLKLHFAAPGDIAAHLPAGASFERARPGATASMFAKHAAYFDALRGDGEALVTLGVYAACYSVGPRSDDFPAPVVRLRLESPIRAPRRLHDMGRDTGLTVKLYRRPAPLPEGSFAVGTVKFDRWRDPRAEVGCWRSTPMRVGSLTMAAVDVASFFDPFTGHYSCVGEPGL